MPFEHSQCFWKMLANAYSCFCLKMAFSYTIKTTSVYSESGNGNQRKPASFISGTQTFFHYAALQVLNGTGTPAQCISNQMKNKSFGHTCSLSLHCDQIARVDSTPIHLSVFVILLFSVTASTFYHESCQKWRLWRHHDLNACMPDGCTTSFSELALYMKRTH